MDKTILNALVFHDSDAQDNLNNILSLATKTVEACQDLDINEFCSIITIMLDRYNDNHNLKFSDTKEAYSRILQIMEVVNSICEPLKNLV